MLDEKLVCTELQVIQKVRDSMSTKKGVNDPKSTLSKTQQVLYQKEFKTADRMYSQSKKRV
ncbi:YfhE family protein [Virgibacillus senegalensis]|uniref:YfhE family protein n=1 Tax=Virgibacillus senegalensis TaxID=1499679 RepID=UPI00069FFD9F|nr:YfhE family protein [Virgibacillus senegalensis]